MPALVTASNEIGELRSITVKEIMAAQKKVTTVWNAQELGFDPSYMKRANLIGLFTPPHREARCHIVEGESPEDTGANLALKLREAKII